MKKLAAVMLCGMLLFSNTVTPQAATVTEVVAELSDLLGVDTSNLVAYLQTIQITESQQSKLNSYISQAKNLLNGKTNLVELSSSERSQLLSIAKEAGSLFGLTVEISNFGDASLTTATISANGRNLLTLNTQDVMHIVKDVDAYLGEIESVIGDLFESEVITVVPDKNSGNNNNNSNNNNSNNSNDNTFKPYPGELKPTGLTTSAFGLSGLVLAGAGVVLARKSSK